MRYLITALVFVIMGCPVVKSKAPVKSVPHSINTGEQCMAQGAMHIRTKRVWDDKEYRHVTTVYGYHGLKIGEVVENILGLHSVRLWLDGPSQKPTHEYPSLEDFNKAWPVTWDIIACYANVREA